MSKEKKGKKPKDTDSTSNFEAGALSAACPMSKTKTVEKKRSILGLGLSTSVRLPTLRSGSTASSNPLSVDSVIASRTKTPAYEMKLRCQGRSSLPCYPSLERLALLHVVQYASTRKKSDKGLRKAEKAESGDIISKTVSDSEPAGASQNETRRTSDGR